VDAPPSSSQACGQMRAWADTGESRSTQAPPNVVCGLDIHRGRWHGLAGMHAYLPRAVTPFTPSLFVNKDASNTLMGQMTHRLPLPGSTANLSHAATRSSRVLGWFTH
jgi:hypothetical protein